MKAILEFDLHDQNDVISYKLTNQSGSMHYALLSLAGRIRQTEKYGAEPITPEEFYKILDENGVKLDGIE